MLAQRSSRSTLRNGYVLGAAAAANLLGLALPVTLMQVYDRILRTRGWRHSRP